ncbi:24559_t:CDS:2, partial [Dentiscutata erythropus]
LGVPIRQWKMLLSEGTAYQYMCDTFDSVITHYKLSIDGYFYFLCLMLHYNFESCPSYLTQSGFDALKRGALDSIRIHINYIVDVLKGLNDKELTKAVLMDNIDLFSESEAGEEIKQLARAVKKGDYVFWRSSARHPWFNKVFVKYGLAVDPINVREPGSGTKPEEFSCEIFLLMEKDLSISPQEVDSEDLAQNFKDKKYTAYHRKCVYACYQIQSQETWRF